jgi:rod shape-determining protein MreC
MNSLLKKTVIVIALTCLGLFVVDRAFYFQQGLLERISIAICSPFLRVSHAISDKLTGWSEKKEAYAQLKNQYETLKKDYLAMVDQVIVLQTTNRQYEAIKELVEFRQRYNQTNRLIATVTTRNISPDEHYYLVNKGACDGVHKDMIALYQNHLVGRVCEVYNHYSKVKLITDQYSKVSAYAAQTNANGIVQGYNCINRCRFCYVSHLLNVNDFDVVVSSGQGLVFPEGFCLGKIINHSLKEKELYHFIEIEPFINLQTIDSCYLVDYDSVLSIGKVA